MTEIYEFVETVAQERLFSFNGIKQKEFDRLVNYAANIIKAAGIALESDAALVVVYGVCNAFAEGFGSGFWAGQEL